MKESTRAPAYACIYHGLAQVAREYGYALAIHGSVLTDLDLIAVPWTDDAVDTNKIMEVIKEHCDACGVFGSDGKESDYPTLKPHGRVAWKLLMTAGGSVDLSVMPRTKGE